VLENGVKTLELDVMKATNKWWASFDAQRRNTNNKSHYDAATQVRVERMKMSLSVLYAAKNIYERYGKQGVSIKLDTPRVRDRAELLLMEQCWDAQGVTKRITPQGIIYRFSKP
jgi:hypothetical protein